MTKAFESPSTRQKNYLVTGAAGFIGSRFAASCKEQGISVISVDHRACFEMRREQLPESHETIDVEDLWTWLEENAVKVDAIIHLGAITDTRENDLERLHKYNTDYTKKLWNFAAKKRIPFIYASSAATYGDGNQGYDDDEKSISNLKPLNAYGQSKQDFDLWALDEERKGHVPPQWSGFKFFNVYGAGENHKGFMASVVLHAYEQILAQGKATLFKSHRKGIVDGDQKRDFIYVGDVVDVLHFAANKPLQRGIFNLGTGQARSFLDLCRAVFRAMNAKEHIEFVETPLAIREKYQYFTEAKMEKLRQAGYTKPFTSIEEGVKKYVLTLKQNKAAGRDR